jgi:ATP-dependent Clp protease ATP-binding subunit ClpB
MGYDPAYGARPLKRVIQKHIQDPLAEEILSGRVNDGDSVDVDVKDRDFVFNGVVPGLPADAAATATATLH